MTQQWAPMARPWPCHGIDMGARDISWTFMNLHGLSWQRHGIFGTAMDFHCLEFSWHRRPWQCNERFHSATVKMYLGTRTWRWHAMTLPRVLDGTPMPWPCHGSAKKAHESQWECHGGPLKPMAVLWQAFEYPQSPWQGHASAVIAHTALLTPEQEVI